MLSLALPNWNLNPYYLIEYAKNRIKKLNRFTYKKILYSAIVGIFSILILNV